MTALALNDLNLSNDLDSQALAAVHGGWVYNGASSVYSSGWSYGAFTIYSNKTYYFGGVKYRVRKAYRRRTRSQRQYLFYKETQITI